MDCQSSLLVLSGYKFRFFIYLNVFVFPDCMKSYRFLRIYTPVSISVFDNPSVKMNSISLNNSNCFHNCIGHKVAKIKCDQLLAGFPCISFAYKKVFFDLKSKLKDERNASMLFRLSSSCAGRSVPSDSFKLMTYT